MASKRRIRRTLMRKQCGNKIKFATIAAAGYAASQVWKNKGARLGVYRCQFCRQYHMGHRPGFVERILEGR